MNSANIARLLITCPDRPGIVAAVSNFLYNHGANIIVLDQHSTDPQGGTFFLRLEFYLPTLDLSRPVLEKTFNEAVAARYGMTWRISYPSVPKKMAILVSRYDHALMELLWRHSRGELPADVVAVISNHPDLRAAVSNFNIPFHEFAVTPETKSDVEQQMIDLLVAHQVDTIVLARYMQILTPRFVDRFPQAIVNIHHSFLPAFVGANPYRQACDRGVKLIGATAHYVTAELDMGPIIEQDVARVSHRQTVDELKRLGQDIERHVLARAVQWHLEDRVIAFENKTIVFA